MPNVGWTGACAQCGTPIAKPSIDRLLSGRGKFCSKGCHMRFRETKHGHNTRSGGTSPTHRTWNHMQQRCENPNNDAYSYYGGRGIKMCDRWRSFENFLADMGERPDGMTLDRIDPNGNYEPGNCRWATKSQQSGNTRQTFWVTYRGERLCLHHLARRLGLDPLTLKGRVTRGWPEDRWADTPKPMGPRYSKHGHKQASA